MSTRTLALTSLAVALATTGFATASVQLAEWTFEESIPTTAGPYAAEGGLFAATSFASGFHADPAAVYSNPVGNGSTESYSSNRWSEGDYYQFQTTTAGYQSISFGWDQTRSGTGPSNFEVQWSTNGTDFDTIFTYEVLAITWNGTTYNPDSTFEAILLPLAASNQTNIFVRLVNLDSPALTGTNRVDNVYFTGRLIPGPGALALIGLGGLASRRRRR